MVLAREDVAGDKRLVAYLTLRDEDRAGDDLEGIRKALRAVLPEYMVPSAFVTLPSFPLTPNGKLDRKALPAPEQDALLRQAYEAPQGAIEESLAAIWSEILHVEQVGRHDHFFDLGGHSLLAVQVISRVQQGMDHQVSLRDLFTYPVLQDFAHHLQGSDVAL